MRWAITCTSLACLAVTTFQSAAHATNLSPGQTLSIGAVPARTGVTLPVFDYPMASAQYDIAPTGPVTNTVQVGPSIGSVVATDASGNSLAAYEQVLTAGQIPDTPTHHYTSQQLPANALLSISGFGTADVDVSALIHPNASLSINQISRSADGNVISFTGFTPYSFSGDGSSNTFLLSSSTLHFGVTDGTLSFVGVDGVDRAFTVPVIGVLSGASLPEPATATLLPLAAAALWARFRRR